ncbi:MAG: hypothetical protein ACI3Z0_07285 [Candidatus Cryptobacteroides sp.]
METKTLKIILATVAIISFVLVGRFWRWHIGFCPGWKQFFASLEEGEREKLRRRYAFRKY